MKIARDQHYCVVFARFREYGRVHVLREGLKVWDSSAYSVLMGRQQALCGAMDEPGLLHGISVFDDADLCHRCIKLAGKEIDTSELFHVFNRPAI